MNFISFIRFQQKNIEPAKYKKLLKWVPFNWRPKWRGALKFENDIQLMNIKSADF